MRIDHFALTVSNIERSQEFYVLFGFQPVLAEPELLDADWISEMTSFPNTQLRVQVLRMPESDSLLELLEYVNPKGESFAAKPAFHVGSAHVCFVVDDIESECNRLESLGVPLRSRYITVPAGYAAAGVKSVYGSDPDGYTFELVQKPVS